MFNNERNRMIANRMNDFLNRNIAHEEIVVNEKFFGVMPEKGDSLENNEDVKPDFYNRAVNGELDGMPEKEIQAEAVVPALEQPAPKMNRVLGSGKSVAVFKGQDEKLFGKGKSGGASSWLSHVKEYAKTHNVSYKQAMKDAKSSYTKSEKPVKAKREPKVKMPKAEKSVKDLPVKSEMRPSGLMGGKKPSSWIAHVKSYAKEHNISYKEALTKSKSSYKK